MSRVRRGMATLLAVTLTIAGALVLGVELRVAGDAIERVDVDRFYERPAGAEDGEPGTIVKTDALLGAPLLARGWRIMYRSTDLNGEPTVVTGILVEPLTPPPAGGRTIVSWGHPTTGAARGCAPSYGFDPYLGIEGLRDLLDRGLAVVATDYEGMGTDGTDSYLIGSTGGRDVLDAARAARAVLGDAASGRVVLWGHSQGGQAVLFAAQEAAAYAPELDVVAVGAAAPAADLLQLMGDHLDDVSGVTIGAYAFTSYARVYGDSVPGARLSDVLTPEALAVVPEMNRICLLANIGRLHEIGAPLVGRFTTVDPTTTEPWRTLLAQNSAGAVGFDAPLFLAQGLSDTLVEPRDTAAFAAHERALGIDVTYHEAPHADHGTVVYLSAGAFVAWLDDVLRDH